ncbi:MAG: amidohydrolase family protein [Candidatus Hodarchaeales archaeon]|jgi:imidazolonepropionase-like amidohydrolase
MSQEKFRLVLRAGNVFDSVSGTIQENHTITIKDRNIIWVGSDSNFEKESNDQILDVEGKVLLPGLIDTHVHLQYTGTAQFEREYYRTSRAMWHYYAMYHAQQHLTHGFTCVRDCGADPEWGPSLKRMFDRNIFAGPRLVVATLPIGQWGDQEAIGPTEYIAYQRKIMEVPTGIDGVKHAVRDRKHSGADFIKTATTGGVLHGQESMLERSLFLDEELVAMRKEAHRLGLHIASHSHGSIGINKAVKAGIDTIEHATFIDEESADLMITKGTYLIPTQVSSFGITSKDIISQLPPEVIEKERKCQVEMIKNHKMAFKKGVLFAIGTDAGTPGNYHGNSAAEITNMVDNVDMTPTQALQAATIEAAKAIRMDEKIGSIEETKLADILVCDGNPLKDISILENQKNLVYVIKDGKIMVERGVLTYFKT